MRLLRFLRRHPLALLGVFTIGFVLWLWRDAISEIRLADPEPPTVHGPIRRELPPPPVAVAQVEVPEFEKPKPTPLTTAQVLPKLKPGMTRVEVEQLVGMPAADIHPATVADGRVTYHMSYEADLVPPATVRPIRPYRPLPKTPIPPRPNDRTLVTLEFDATKPGHPLLGIYYPDPLF